MKKLKYLYTLPENMIIYTDIFDREFSNDWIKIEPDGFLKIRKGYSWDGCTPKFKVFDVVIGTPEGQPAVIYNYTEKPLVCPITFPASCAHDALYQFKHEIPFTRAEADYLFYKMLKTQNFKLAKVYYNAVRIFGRFFGEWLNK